MTEAESQYFLSLAEEVYAQRNCISDRSLDFFSSLKGWQSHGELMVVGRAINGWQISRKPSELSSKIERERLLADLSAIAHPPSRCPMLWVSELWGRGNKYNTHRSAFWRVIRSAVSVLQIANVLNADWPSYLIWSNLYKVAPTSGGNPSRRLVSLQHEFCQRILQIEIQEFKPKRLLLLTGFDWFGPFLNSSVFSFNANGSGRLVLHYGKLSVAGLSFPINTVVGVHPQGKSETRFIEEIKAAFSDLRAGV